MYEICSREGACNVGGTKPPPARRSGANISFSHHNEQNMRENESIQMNGDRDRSTVRALFILDKTTAIDGAIREIFEQSLRDRNKLYRGP